MAIPSRTQQARTLASWLEAGAEDEEDLDRFSLRIVDAFHEMLKNGLKGRSEFPEVGTAFKSPLSSKVYWMTYSGFGDTVWLTTDDSSYGWLVNKRNEFFDYVTPSSAKTGKPGTNEYWSVGDWVSSFQGALRHKVLAVTAKAVLLSDDYGDALMAQSNKDMEKYTKESKV